MNIVAGCMGFRNAAVGRINKVTALRGFFCKMYGRFAGTKKWPLKRSDCINEVIVTRGYTVHKLAVSRSFTPRGNGQTGFIAMKNTPSIFYMCNMFMVITGS